MKRIIVAVVLLVVMLFATPISAASAEGNVTIYFEYLTDSNGYNYGADYFVDSTVNAEVYVYPYIQSQENVHGDVISGTLLMRPNEKHVRVGSFISRDRSKAWSVNVGAKWKRADEK